MVKNNNRYSYSKMNQYENCPYAFNLKYNKGMFIDPPGLAAEFGTLVHKILELETDDLMNNKPIDYEGLRNYFINVNLPKKSKWDRDGDIFGTKVLSLRYPKEWGDATTAKSGKSYGAKAQDFLNKGIFRLESYMKDHPNLELVGAEIQFEYEYGNYMFYGFIDRVLRDKENPKKFIVMDIKTKDHPFKDQDLTAPLQFVVYCMALRDKYGDDIEIECFYDLPIIDLIQAAGTKGFEKRGIKKIDKILSGIEDKNFAPNPCPLCYYCPFSNTNPKQPVEGVNQCPYYSLWRPGSPSFERKLEWLGEEKHEEQMKKLLEIEKQEGQKITKRNFTF